MPQEFFLPEHSCFPSREVGVFTRRPQDFCARDRFFFGCALGHLTEMAKWRNLMSWSINAHNDKWYAGIKVVAFRSDISFCTSVPSLCLKMILKIANHPLPPSKFCINLRAKWPTHVFHWQLSTWLVHDQVSLSPKSQWPFPGGCCVYIFVWVQLGEGGLLKYVFLE